jgi:hypothetical protein
MPDSADNNGNPGDGGYGPDVGGTGFGGNDPGFGGLGFADALGLANQMTFEDAATAVGVVSTAALAGVVAAAGQPAAAVLGSISAASFAAVAIGHLASDYAATVQGLQALGVNVDPMDRDELTLVNYGGQIYVVDCPSR